MGFQKKGQYELSSSSGHHVIESGYIPYFFPNLLSQSVKKELVEWICIQVHLEAAMRKVRRPLHKSLLSTRVRRANQDDAHEDEIVQAGGSNEAISVRGRSLNLSIGPQWRSLRTLTPTLTAHIKIGLLDMFIEGLSF